MRGVQVVFALAVLPWWLGLAGLRVVVTPSVPRGLYATSELTGEPHRGDYVCVEAQSDAAPEALRLDHDGFSVLLKRVAAVAGDRVELTSEAIAVNGKVLPLSKHLGRDSQGRPLPHPVLPLTLGAGQVWVTSEHERGYDSRYFGPVGLSALSCTGRPLWTW